MPVYMLDLRLDNALAEGVVEGKVFAKASWMNSNIYGFSSCFSLICIYHYCRRLHQSCLRPPAVSTYPPLSKGQILHPSQKRCAIASIRRTWILPISNHKLIPPLDPPPRRPQPIHASLLILAQPRLQRLPHDAPAQEIND